MISILCSIDTIIYILYDAVISQDWIRQIEYLEFKCWYVFVTRICKWAILRPCDGFKAPNEKRLCCCLAWSSFIQLFILWRFVLCIFNIFWCHCLYLLSNGYWNFWSYKSKTVISLCYQISIFYLHKNYIPENCSIFQGNTGILEERNKVHIYGIICYRISALKVFWPFLVFKNVFVTQKFWSDVCFHSFLIIHLHATSYK